MFLFIINLSVQADVHVCLSVWVGATSLLLATDKYKLQCIHLNPAFCEHVGLDNMDVT
jgi:hypothetical protein